MDGDTVGTDGTRGSTGNADWVEATIGDKEAWKAAKQDGVRSRVASKMEGKRGCNGVGNGVDDDGWGGTAMLSGEIGSGFGSGGCWLRSWWFDGGGRHRWD